LWAVEGSRVTLAGEDFPIDPVLPHVRVGAAAARLVYASSTALAIVVPEGVDGGSTAVRVEECPGEAVFVEIGAAFASGVHQVDSPAYDRHGNLYVTYSGSRGQQAPVGIFRVRPDGTREPFVSDVPNPTSLTFDRHGRLYASSRFDGSVYAIESDGRATLFAGELGVACGLAFGPDDALYVGDRSGTVLRIERDGHAHRFATLPSSVAAFHLAFGPDQVLYVTAPTLDPADVIYRISPSGDVEVFAEGFGRPQGLAFDNQHHLFVVDAVAGGSTLYRLRLDNPSSRDVMLEGAPLIGVAFDPHGGAALAASETVYRLAADVRPWGQV
jgi:sugar lactone lactonase YvrE